MHQASCFYSAVDQTKTISYKVSQRAPKLINADVQLLVSIPRALVNPVAVRSAQTQQCSLNVHRLGYSRYRPDTSSSTFRVQPKQLLITDVRTNPGAHSIPCPSLAHPAERLSLMVHETFHILGAVKADLRLFVNEHGQEPLPNEVWSMVNDCCMLSLLEQSRSTTNACIFLRIHVASY